SAAAAGAAAPAATRPPRQPGAIDDSERAPGATAAKARSATASATVRDDRLPGRARRADRALEAAGPPRARRSAGPADTTSPADAEHAATAARTASAPVGGACSAPAAPRTGCAVVARRIDHCHRRHVEVIENPHHAGRIADDPEGVGVVQNEVALHDE